MKQEMQQKQQLYQEAMADLDRLRVNSAGRIEIPPTRSKPQPKMDPDKTPRPAGLTYQDRVAQVQASKDLEPWTPPEPMTFMRNMQINRYETHDGASHDRDFLWSGEASNVGSPGDAEYQKVQAETITL